MYVHCTCTCVNIVHAWTTNSILSTNFVGDENMYALKMSVCPYLLKVLVELVVKEGVRHVLQRHRTVTQETALRVVLWVVPEGRRGRGGEGGRGGRGGGRGGRGGGREGGEGREGGREGGGEG